MVSAENNARALDPMPLNDEGPVRVVPTAEIAFGYDDNVQQAPEGEAVDRQVARLSPNLQFSTRRGDDRYQLDYRPELLVYDGDRYGNRVNHNLVGLGNLGLNARNRASLNLQASRNQALLSDTNRDNNETEGDINERFALDGRYEYGADNARGQVHFILGYAVNRYANNRGVDGSNKQSEEYDSPSVGTAFFWRIAPKTRALTDVTYTDYRYQWDQSTLDSDNLNTSVGLSWEATAKTQGEIRLGRERKSFADPAKPDEMATSWQAEIIWEPTSFSTVTLASSSNLDEGSEGADNQTRESAIRARDYDISWRHEWNSRFATEIGYQRLNEDYIAASGRNVGRVDRTREVSLSLQYRFRRWMDVGLTATQRDKDASVGPASSYQQNVYFLSLEVSL
ncbi:UNVERIFIED_CONTAM: outer membrane beta-barrel protein [Spiribacter pallidus]|jgi:hypothetical protein